MNPKLNIDNLIRQQLPAHKRQPNRLRVLRALLAPLRELFTLFDAWRANIRMTINVNSQVIILEGYLRRKFNEPITIRIVTFDDGLLPVGYHAEGRTMMQPIGFYPESPPPIPFAGEVQTLFGDADFIVYIPAWLDIEAVRAEIERYKKATAIYKIIQN